MLLTSPEGAVIGGVAKAHVTIRGSGSRTGGRAGAGGPGSRCEASPLMDGNLSTAGGCRLHPGQHAPVLGGEEIPSVLYPPHGSIHLEKLPLGPDPLTWTRGDSISRPSGDAAAKKVRVVGNPQVVGVRFPSWIW